MFGQQPCPVAGPSLSSELETKALKTLEGAARQLQPRTVSGSLGQRLSEAVGPAIDELRPLTDQDQWSDGHQLTVVLMGRTTAGKSTLLEALTHGDGSRQGRGGQRTTRRVHRAAAHHADLADVVIVDTPGVGAHDGREDWAAAFAQVPEADLIVWVAANDAHQEETTRALRQLAMQGKPIVVALNCRYPVDGLDVLLSTSGEIFLKHPDLAFDEADDHARVLRRHLEMAGVADITVVPIHARAAYLGTTSIERSLDLLSASRIADLIDVLATQRASTAHAQLVVLRKVDRLREPAVKARVALTQAIHTAEAMVARQRQEVADADRRMSRAIQRVEREVRLEANQAIDIRRQWHSTADPGKNVEEEWAAEAGKLKADVDTILRRYVERLNEAQHEAARQTAADWSTIPMPDLDPEGFTGFGSVLANRLAKGALGLGSGLLGRVAAGAATGAAAGLYGGPVGIALGTVAGAATMLVVGAIGSQISNWVGRLVKGKDRVLKERRAQLGEQTKGALDQYTQQVEAEVARLARAHQSAIDKWSGESDDERQQAERLIEGWAEFERELTALTSWLDLMTAQELMQAAGRTRGAHGVRRAVRGPQLLAVELTEPAFSEVALFPVAPTPLPIVVAPDHSSMTSGQALNLMVQLQPERTYRTRLTSRGADFVLDAAVADGVLDAWEAVLSEFTGTTVTLDRPDGSRTSQHQTSTGNAEGTQSRFRAANEDENQESHAA